LAPFERAHPDIELQLVATTRVLDLRHDQVELAIRHGKGNCPGVEAEFLLDEVALPVAAPGYLTVQPGEALLDALRRVRLIVNSLTPDEWEEWARARGLEPPNRHLAVSFHDLFEPLERSLARIVDIAGPAFPTFRHLLRSAHTSVTVRP
jgi:LysR family glycine cleavage system transcriptional activator